MFAITYAAALLAIVLTVAAAAFLIYRRTALHVVLGAYLLSASLWIGGNVAADVSFTPDWLHTACVVAFVGAMLKVILQFLIPDLLIDGRFPPLKRALAYAVPCLALAALSGTEHAIQGMAFPPGEPAQITPGILYSFALVLSLSSVAYGVARLAFALGRERDSTRRMQFWYVLTGLIATGACGILFTILLPLLGEYRFYSVGPLSTIFFAAGCAYAIKRHRLLDIRIAAQQGLMYALLLAGIVGLYLGLTLTATHLLNDSTGLGILFSAGIAMVAGVLGSPLFERWFRRLTDPIFFKDTYVYADALHTLTQVLHRHVELHDLVRESERALAAILRASSVRIALGKDEEDGAPGNLRIPLEIDGRVVGGIALSEKRSGDPYTHEDRQLLETFAYQAATALSRAQLYALAQDETARLEAKVRERTRELSEARERERQVMNDLSHNLQTPLTVLQTRLERLKRERSGSDEVASLEQALAGFSGFVYDLLALARLESGMGLEQAPVDISALSLDLAEEMTVVAEARGIEMRTAIDGGVHVLGDERRLREALMNILGNALAYMKEDGTREIRFMVEARGAEVTLTVADTGIGIDASDLPHVFDRFYRGKRTAKSVKGTGLGLAIAKSIIEQHGGRIDATSAKGEGTAIAMRLPRIEPSSDRS